MIRLEEAGEGSVMAKEIAELIKEALLTAGAKRVAVRTEIDCLLLEADFLDEVIISTIYNPPKSNFYLVKITPASKAYGLLKGCEALKYTPYGLYALIQTYSDLEKVIEKVRKVLKLKDVWK